jgi:hypothetical protein
VSGHVPLVQTLHPMLPGGGSAITVCAKCEEVWPCTVTDLLELVQEGLKFLETVERMRNGSVEFREFLPSVQPGIDNFRAVIAKVEGR